MMAETAKLDLDPAVSKANLDALRKALPHTAKLIDSAQPPHPLEIGTARDGSPNYVWNDHAGHLCWLGRTSMPSLRAEGLVDAFQSGGGNILFYGMGQGSTVHRLLRRLHLYQAVIVIESESWAVAATLRLHDFADDIQRQRLLIFTGDQPWEDCRTFLLEHDGFLTPERALSWPWFETDTVDHVTHRLAEIQTSVAQHRKKPVEQADLIGRPGDQRTEPSIVIATNVCDPDIHRLAEHLAQAAEHEGWSCHCFVLDSPAMVHTRAIETELRSFQSAVMILIDVVPDALHYRLPDGPVFIVCSHGQRLSEDWLKKIPRTAWLGVRTDCQRVQAIEGGLTESRVVFLPPAAICGLKPGTGDCHATGILVIGDWMDRSAEAAGLHLKSHSRLWQATADLIRQRVDRFTGQDSERILASAEKTTGMYLQSEEVRQGLIDRIQHRLGPMLVQEAYCSAMEQAGVDFDLYGSGWKATDMLASHYRGPWPKADDLTEMLSGAGLIISLDISGGVPERLPDALSNGVAGMVRQHPLDETADGLSAILQPDQHLWRFESRRELIEKVRDYRENPTPFFERAAAAAEHLAASHTWVHRLQAILRCCHCESQAAEAAGRDIS